MDEPLNIGDISPWLSIGNEMLGENTLKRGRGCCDIVLFFRGTMFEFQSCHYYEKY